VKRDGYEDPRQTVFNMLYWDVFVTSNEKKIGRQYQKRRKNMRNSGLFYFSSNDRFKKETINYHLMYQ
jgi:hypothetical protein